MSKSKSSFAVEDYKIEQTADGLSITITGKKTGPPNRRLALHGTTAKINDIQITHTSKNKTVEHTVERINYLPTINQTRIHTTGLLYPGNYELKLKLDSADHPEINAWFI